MLQALQVTNKALFLQADLVYIKEVLGEVSTINHVYRPILRIFEKYSQFFVKKVDSSLTPWTSHPSLAESLCGTLPDPAVVSESCRYNYFSSSGIKKLLMHILYLYRQAHTSGVDFTKSG